MITFDFGLGPVPAHRHTNGGGWVADSARVAAAAYIGREAQVFGEARVSGEAQVFDKARVFGEAWVFGEAQVFDKAQVFGEARVSGEAWVFDKAQVSGEAWVFGEARVLKTSDYVCLGPIGSRNAVLTVTKTPVLQFSTGCFCGSLEQFEAAVASHHKDSHHGQEYRAAIAFAQAWATIEEVDQ